MNATVRVLLVEDDHADARLFLQLAPVHYAVEHVTHGAAALKAVEQGGFDLCFVDDRLEAEGGLDLVRRLHRLRPSMPIIFLAGQDARSLGENALLAGAAEYLQKSGISTAAIERVGRLALIRRHAGRATGDEASARALTRSLADARPPLAGSETLRRLIYLSSAREVFWPPDLLALCAKAAAANARVGVTGVLVLTGDRFLQVLEGPPTAVGVLLDRIGADPRHSSLAVVHDGPAALRLYPEWNMGYLQLGTTMPIPVEKWAEVALNAGKALSRISDNRTLLDAFIAEMPRWLRGSVAPAEQAATGLR